MQTVRGYFNGTSIELLEDAPTESTAYVLITFLEGGLATASARGQRLRVAQEAQQPPQVYSEQLRKQMDSQYRKFTVGAIMTRRLISVLSSATVNDALHIMREQGITSVLVEPENNGAGEWGIMTMRDLLKQMVTPHTSPDQVKVRDIATKPLITVSPDTSLSECGKLMIESNIRRIVVVQNDHHIGIISDTDIFQFVEEYGWEPQS